MTNDAKPAGSGIRLLVSDVDGTLVTADKRISEATIAAARRLADHGIGFTVISSRPPFGLRHVIETLGLTLPIGGFNGGAIVAPDLTVLDEHVLPEAAARVAVQRLDAAGVAVWVFADGRWLLRDPQADYVARERHTLMSEPVVVADFEFALGRVGKIVGASPDFAKLEACEADLAAALGATASVARSQRYYLDVTPAGLSKGTFVAWLSRHTGIPTAAIAGIGDMDNDVPLLRACGLAIAMGNGSPAAKSAAMRVTRSNDEDGVAWAIDTMIIDQTAG